MPGCEHPPHCIVVRGDSVYCQGCGAIVKGLPPTFAKPGERR